MWQELFALLKSEAGSIHLNKVATMLSNLKDVLASEYSKDGNVRNALIDSLIDLLQKEKV